MFLSFRYFKNCVKENRLKQTGENVYANIESNLQTPSEAAIIEIKDVLEAKNGPKVQSEDNH